MKGKYRDISIILVTAFIAVILALVSDTLYFSNIEWRFRTSRLNKLLITKETECAALIHKVEREFAAGKDVRYLMRTNSLGSGQNNNVIFLIYENSKLRYWSDNSVGFPEKYESTYEAHTPVFVSNGWFIPVYSKYQKYDLVALICVYRQYPIKNDLLLSGFPEDYKLPSGTQITFDSKASRFAVTGVEGNFHFGLIFPEIKPNTIFIIIPVFFWFVAFLLWIYLVGLLTKFFASRFSKTVTFLFGGFLLLIVYVIVLKTGPPASVRSTELFSPFTISAGWILPSIGHLLLISILLISALYFHAVSGKPSLIAQKARGKELIHPILLFAGAFGFFLMTEAIFKSIITRSTLNFEAYKILDVSFMSLVGFGSVIILLAIPVVLFIRAFRIIQAMRLRRQLLLMMSGSLIIPLCSISGVYCSIWGILFILAVAIVVMAWVNNTLSLFASVIIYAAITGVYSTAIIKRYSDRRDSENLKVLAVSLANDNDMMAESMLIDMWPVIRNDTTLSQLMKREFFSPSDINNVYRYLQSRYFIGYWDNYDLSIIICRDDSPLQIPSQSSYASNCFLYFDERIKSEGDSITGTGTWFMHNEAGRAYYLSRLFYNFSPFLTNGLFIELVSHIETYQAGYPELLTNGTTHRFPALKDISYAKYSAGTLVLRSGDYPYDNRLIPVISPGEEYKIIRQNGYKHIYYNRGDMTLVITRELISPLNTVVTFAYLFIVIIVFSFLLLLIFTGRDLGLLNMGSFRVKLQIAFAGVLSIVFIIIITASIMLIIAQFKGNHTKLLMEKITSVSIELEHRLSGESSLNTSWRSGEFFSLDEMLVKFSNVFMTDINLYSPGGNLLATSRNEVFSEKLEGTMINPLAFKAMTVDGKPEYLGEEKIGNLKYLSAYMPFYNQDNQLLAYINLPYFKMQNLLTGEISNMVVTIINFTLLLLMLMMWLSVFLSERLTSPMTLLQRAMASVEYGKKNEYIHYNSRDEVGELVRQYNRMIDELDESAGKLARSERELAWREMARQIAHEIKNPLTPMKLNVQQLYKWWKDGVSDFPTKLQKFTDNQIEYIDNLSSIASAFSYFARLPGAEPAEVDVLTQLSASLEMFGHTEEAAITLDTGNISKAVIMADKEHLNGIFSNLIKNAIQAIPSGTKGIITITISASFDKLLIVIKDNGVGIPEEIKPRMFTPNFTTKSSGMGLGLSIVKRYVETAGGKIWFESERGKGTSFFIELPLLFTVERLDSKTSEK